MTSTTVRVERNRDAASAAQHATRRQMLDLGQTGFNAAQSTIQDDATDTAQLERSGFQPTMRDGSVEFGWSADYAAAVNDGSAPHWAPIQPLLGWARRVLGDASLGYAVQRKIAREGTDPVGFVDDALESMRNYASTHGMDDLLSERL